MLDPAQIAQFRNDGYMVIPAIVPPQELESLRRAYDGFLRGEFAQGADDRHLGNAIRQILWPSRVHELFRWNGTLQHGLEISRQLFNIADPVFGFDMLISKEPGNLNETPWHQDYSYFAEPYVAAGTPLPNRQLQFWVALDDVDEANGCMHFVPGHHSGRIQPHYVAAGGDHDPHRLLAMVTPPPQDVIKACPLRAGDCTVHYEGTPHFTSGNRTADRQRRAYIFDFYNRQEQ